MFLKASRFFLYLAPLCVAVVLVGTFFPFIGGKYFFFRVAVELSFIFFVLWWGFGAAEGEVFRRMKSLFSKPLVIAVSVFVLVFLLATVFADNPGGAFWSNYERGDGGFQMIHYYLFFLLSVFLFREWTHWRLLFRVSLAAAALMILYGLFGYFAILSPNLFCSESSGPHPVQQCISFITPYQGQGATIPKTLWGLFTQNRFQGSLGNPAYVAPYLMFSMFYALYLWGRERGGRQLVRNILYGSSLLVFLFFFFISQTRGAFLGLGAAIFFFFIYLALEKKEWRIKIGATAAILVVLTSILVYNRKSDFVTSLPGGRLFDLSFSEQTVQTRLWTWGSAWKGFLERPILGWGPENFSAVFDKHFDPRHYVPGQNTETWFDRAHSVFFDYLAETGILGALSYLAIFIIFYREFFRFRGRLLGERNAEISPSLLRSFIFALPIGYLVQGLALFDVLPIYINFFLFLGFGSWLFYKEEA
ncbi:O-antigen ligase domain-containing protein [Candidatus Parcubacteria bacterium]|nr:MAG: O-antigen ligase domain-containing protein [Candidatus Parcubacteria bacterium]